MPRMTVVSPAWKFSHADSAIDKGLERGLRCPLDLRSSDCNSCSAGHSRRGWYLFCWDRVSLGHIGSRYNYAIYLQGRRHSVCCNRGQRVTCAIGQARGYPRLPGAGIGNRTGIAGTCYAHRVGCSTPFALDPEARGIECPALPDVDPITCDRTTRLLSGGIATGSVDQARSLGGDRWHCGKRYCSDFLCRELHGRRSSVCRRVVFARNGDRHGRRLLGWPPISDVVMLAHRCPEPRDTWVGRSPCGVALPSTIAGRYRT